ncbi:YbhB/YbcL family Raf kinase inhibitor-like protein [Paenibacillus massiliensis]|uniref:YbhB/YbcL family Raf kinase inhibitor-like protein n=1 Tax=Paenibacillus massiliensis TaxID=225917 RepID=UPI00049183A9|nr:YbhB/YbcL family Raf kinase inhibitor-like protein [Paenibacillus massiliensis]
MNNPYAKIPEVQEFILKSSDITSNQSIPSIHLSGLFGIPGGEDVSPELSWEGAPEGTKSFAVTMYDPDAPTGSGFWHWAVVNIPANVTDLPRNAGIPDGANLPNGAYQLPNDARTARFIGAAPPAGHGVHRYYFVVHALDVEDIGVGAEATPAFLGFNMFGHTLGRAMIVAHAEVKE